MLYFPSDIQSFSKFPNFIEIKLQTRKNSSSTTLEDLETVFLTLPNDIKTSSTIDWSATEIGKIGNTIEANGKPISTNEAIGMVGGAITDASSKLMSLAASALGGSLSADDITGLSSKQIANPYISALFKGVGLRAYSFTFEFFPRNPEECDDIKKIVDLFKFASLPGRVQDSNDNEMSSMLTYPSEIEHIKFHTGNKVNEYMPSFGRSAITSFGVDYSIETFRNGHPQKITMALGFTELKAENKNDLNTFWNTK